ncbi:MAG: hypothetical protein CMQ19_01800 [Gammaproteobacteria bacterium]|nr:hypothetical protein [Gammaproteobacteria bacterium]|tara:strand:+ start:518 stop:1594 length:1077 start_codon:yes stop_codon:yes gene_type:complete
MGNTIIRLFSAIAIFAAGLATGWMIHDVDKATVDIAVPPKLKTVELNRPRDLRVLYAAGNLEQVVTLSQGEDGLILALTNNATSDRARTLLRRYMETHGEFFAGLVQLALMEKKNKNFEQAIGLIERANLLAVSEDQEKILNTNLRELSVSYQKNLVAVENYERLDEFYERITLAMPEQAHYLLKLGMLRISLGNYEAALAPLSQIENHPQYGEKARGLIAQTDVDESFESLEVLPLWTNGNQFVVEALIDEGSPINLLIDTGAAMTVLDEGILVALGYNLNGQRQELFSTANGVVAAPVISIQQLALGGAAMGPLSVGALTLSMSGDIDGLLGMNFLRHYDFRIDQDRRELHLNSER